MKLILGYTISIILPFISLTKQSNENEKFCSSTECIHTSASILTRINTDINPCDNFYDFSCGAFDETLVPDEHSSIDVNSQLNDNIDQELKSIAEIQPVNGLYKLIHGLYEKCMDNSQNINQKSAEYEVKTLDELRKLINSLGGCSLIDGTSWKSSNWTIDDAVKKMRMVLGYRENEIFKVKSNNLFANLARNLNIYPSDLSTKYKEAYYKYVKETFENLKNTDDDIHEDITELLGFEYKLNELYFRLSKFTNLPEILKLSTQFEQTILQLQWLNLFHPSLFQYIEVADYENKNEFMVLTDFKTLLSSTKIRTQANFLIWRLVDYAGSQVIGSVKYSKFQLEHTINGKQDMEQSWKECINVIKSELAYVTGWHFTKDDPFKLKRSAIEILDSIKYEFSLLINNSRWFDDAVRVELNKKIEHLSEFIAYPDVTGFNESEIINFYDEIDVVENQYYRSLLQLRIIDADNKFKETFASKDSDDNADCWKKYLPPTLISAVYSPFENSLRLSMAALRQIINQEQSLKYLNFGTIGFIVGREISHIVNQLFNNAPTMLDVKSLNKFVTKKQCIIKQYDSYCDPETLKCLDGKRIVNENIADILGIKLAYNAFQRWNNHFNVVRHKLIGVNFSETQLFWIVMAQNLCKVSRREELERRISSDIYAIERFRIIGMVENSPDFFNDFKCFNSTRTNRASKCVIL